MASLVCWDVLLSRHIRIGNRLGVAAKAYSSGIRHPDCGSAAQAVPSNLASLVDQLNSDRLLADTGSSEVGEKERASVS